jgi:selenocysteine lyase/cysteine desulfurase
MTLKQSIDWKNEWFPIDDATYLNFAAHAAIPRVALNAVQASVAAKMRPHIVDDLSFFSVAASLRQTLATLIGASPDEIALTSGAGAGLAEIAYALKWSAGDEVIIARGEFPVQYATWKPMEAREGIKVQIVVPATKFICPAALARRMVSPFVGRWAGRLAWSKARSPHEGWQLNCWLCSKALWAILITFDES